MSLQNPLADHWMIPVIQGFVQMERCKMDFSEDKKESSSDSMSDFLNTKHKEPLEYNIRIISRRNRHRAGTTWYTHITVIFVLNGLDTTSESSLAETGIEQVQHGTHIYNSYLCFKRVGYNIRIISRRNRHRAGTTWYTHI